MKFLNARDWIFFNGFARTSNEVKLRGKSSSSIQWIRLFESDLRELNGIKFKELTRSWAQIELKVQHSQLLQRRDGPELAGNGSEKIIIQITVIELGEEVEKDEEWTMRTKSEFQVANISNWRENNQLKGQHLQDP